LNSAKNLIDTGSGFLESGKYKEAVSYFTRALETDPYNSKAYELRGVANYFLLNTDQALSDLTQAISLDQQNDTALLARGSIFRDKQDYGNAINDFSRTVQINPDNIQYRLNLCHAYLATKNIEKAIELADGVLMDDPINYYALYYKASALVELKHYVDAFALYKKILRNHDPTSDIYNSMGFCQIYTREFEKAKNNFSLAIDLNMEYAYPWNNLGYVYYLQEDFSKALEFINHSIDLDPSNSWAFKNRGIVYLAIGERDKALSDLTHARDLGYTDQYDNEVDYLLKNHF